MDDTLGSGLSEVVFAQSIDQESDKGDLPKDTLNIFRFNRQEKKVVQKGGK